MNAKRPPGLFIAGTDTGIGKTYVTSVIARSLVAKGHRVGVYKPVLSGFSLDLSSYSDADLQGCVDDDVRLWQAADCPGELLHVAPQRFRAPLAPHLAARQEGRQVDSELLRRGVEYWQATSDLVLVEGAGGLFSPIADHELVADLVLDLGYPVVLVTENRLGAINQALQAHFAARAYRTGIPLAAIVLNEVPPAALDHDLSRSNLDEVARRIPRPVFTLAAGSTNFHPSAPDWFALARTGN